MSEDGYSNRDWIMLVKRTREKFGVSIDEAYDPIFADEEMRPLVALRIARNPECRKMALHDIRRSGTASRSVKIGGTILFRTLPGELRSGDEGDSASPTAVA